MRDPKSIVPGQAPSWRDLLLASYRRHGWKGFTRLYDFLKPVAGRREIQVRSRYGSQFLLSPWDSVDSHVLLEGFYESEVLEALRPALSADGAVLWVIGANFGLHAITAKMLHPEARVIAFEPSPSMGGRLLDNCFLNKIEIELHAYALSDREDVLKFYANASGNPGMSTLHPCDGFTYDHTFSVCTRVASQVIEQRVATAPTALLVDAEGAEEEIFRGFGDHLANPTLRHIVFETENDFLETSNPRVLGEIFAGAGFGIEKLSRQEDTAHALSNFLATRN